MSASLVQRLTPRRSWKCLNYGLSWRKCPHPVHFHHVCLVYRSETAYSSMRLIEAAQCRHVRVAISEEGLVSTRDICPPNISRLKPTAPRGARALRRGVNGSAAPGYNKSERGLHFDENLNFSHS
jgi:hypothetical protein